MQFRPYQEEIIKKGTEVITRYSFLYLAMEVRTGKTLTSFGIANNLKVQSVLFITKKKAISSIKNDYALLKPDYQCEVINYESLHKLSGLLVDLIVVDEAHSLGAFPKPSKRAKMVRDLISINNCYVILLSGTPTPESFSQMYHQVYGIKNNPFNSFKNFYRFARTYVRLKTKHINSFPVMDYSDGMKTILDAMKPYTIAYSQKEAGFKVKTEETVLEVDMNNSTYVVANMLKKNRVVQGEGETILADTPVKLMMKLHQLYSGTIIFESGNSSVLDYSKAEFIAEKFGHLKIGIFYKFKEELKALKHIYEDRLTTELEDFDSTDKSIALQIVSGREGISLRKADCLIYYNIDFSATSYWQSRDRMTTKNTLLNKVYWIFSKNGIEKNIYKAVTNKKDYTLSHFKKDLLSL
jgi:hypothetical protein